MKFSETVKKFTFTIFAPLHRGAHIYKKENAMENWYGLFEEEIKKIRESGVKPRLLLHACCAPCSSHVLTVLREIFDITVFFYNPNIQPESEFDFRYDELYRLISEMGLSVRLIKGDYDTRRFFEIAASHETDPEGGPRCYGCYRLRLSAAASVAEKEGFDYFTTTLSISPHKNAEWLNKIGEELQKEYGVRYLYSDFKKKEGYKHSIELSRQYNLYRQDYCGCVYSKKAKEKMSKDS